MVNGNASLPSRYSFQPFERVRIFANQQHQGGGLRIGFSAALFPFLQSSFVDPQLARKDGSRVAQSLTRVPDQLRINPGERRWINLVVAQSELTLRDGPSSRLRLPSVRRKHYASPLSFPPALYSRVNAGASMNSILLYASSV